LNLPNGCSAHFSSGPELCRETGEAPFIWNMWPNLGPGRAMRGPAPVHPTPPFYRPCWQAIRLSIAGVRCRPIRFGLRKIGIIRTTVTKSRLQPRWIG